VDRGIAILESMGIGHALVAAGATAASSAIASAVLDRRHS